MPAEYRLNDSGQLRQSNWLELCLALLGLLALTYCLVAHLAAQSAMRHAIAIARPTQSAGLTTTAQSDVLGTIAIPQLHLSAPITSGIGTIELVRGVGHIPGTAFAGGLGTMALAGHRDTFFRALRHVAPGMMIQVSGATGTFHYEVDSTEVVDPAQVGVLDIGGQPELVLITCFPFDYIGAAPRRFIVHAHLLSAASDQER